MAVDLAAVLSEGRGVSARHARLLPPPVSLVSKEKQLCSLWAGYGRVTAVDVLDGRGSRSPVVVKRVAPPASNSDAVGHARKLDSYRAEACFYRSVGGALAGDGGCQVAAPLAVVEDGAGGRYALTLALTDLRPTHPHFCKGSLNSAQLKACLRWLAAFHASFWGLAGAPPDLATRQGTFWHLATRPDEHASMPDCGEWGELKRAAAAIDARLRARASGPHGTLVHGDAKAANFCWAAREGGSEAAAFDFQYVGAGVGARDVAYLLSSAGSASDGEGACLDLYHEALMEELASRGRDPAGYDRETLRSDYDLSAADFVRFMAGWGWWGAGADRAAATARVVAARVRREDEGGREAA